MDKHLVCRRKMLKQTTAMLASLVAIPIVTTPRPAFANAASKSDVHYQNHPHDGKKCWKCVEFLPSSQAPNAEGTCRIVAGPIDPNGWCMAFTSK